MFVRVADMIFPIPHGVHPAPDLHALALVFLEEIPDVREVFW
jgi:hypothetical protein